MTTAREQLMALTLSPDAFEQSAADLDSMQLAALQEYFDERRKQITVLDRRASDQGIDRITSLEDAVPLLFSHTTYKSYPQSFIDKGQWSMLTRWLGTLSTAPVDNVDLDGVADVDEFIERLWQAGHLVLATSGTSGRCSFLNRTVADRAFLKQYMGATTGWPRVIAPDNSRRYYQMGPKSGPNMSVETAALLIELFAAPGEVVYLSEEPLRLSEVNKMAAFRRSLVDGTATPADVARQEREQAERAPAAEANLARVIDDLIEHRHQPIFTSAVISTVWLVIERARARGIGDGEFHPDSLMGGGGGVKGAVLPDDYQDQITRFWGNVHRNVRYGMTEMNSQMPRCEAQRYHRVPTTVMLLVDAPGERLVHRAGQQVEGRFAFVDLSVEGRWGGLITGDKVTADFSPTCPCGRSGPTLLDPIGRVTLPGEEDKVGCAGTIDAYIRGAMA